MCAISCSWVFATSSRSSCGHRAALQVVLVAEGHQAGVLHRAGVELRHEDLVVLAERVAHRRTARGSSRTRPGWCRAAARRRGTAPSSAATRRRSRSRRGPRARRGTARRRRRTGRSDSTAVGRELPAPRPDPAARRVGEHGPLRRCGHREREGRLQVGLVEAGEDRGRVVEERLAVQVGPLVLGVGVAVQALTGAGVGEAGPHPQLVRLVRAQRRQREPAVRPARGVHGRAVQLGVEDLLGLDLDPRRLRPQPR